MLLTELRLENLRRFENLTLALSPGWNVFTGANGAGKTTLLEAAYLLSHGRSFRAGGRTGVQREGAGGFSVFGLFVDQTGRDVRAGLARQDGRLLARVDGDAVSLSELVRACPVVCFDPGSHELISGAAEVRRQFLDWGVFHVEHEFLDQWRRYQRVLRQRNALLRIGGSDSEFPAWDSELAAAGEALASSRETYMQKLMPYVSYYASRLLPELGDPTVVLQQGWDASLSLAESLAQSLPRDRERGHTTRGAHRSDWSLRFALASKREHFSRGQEKLVALIMLLAQAKLHAEVSGGWPVFCFDDLASELDRQHQQAVVQVLAVEGVQALVTGTELPICLQEPSLGAAVFHVEHGKVDRLI